MNGKDHDNESSTFLHSSSQKFSIKHVDPAVVEEMLDVYQRTMGNFNSIDHHKLYHKGIFFEGH